MSEPQVASPPPVTREPQVTSEQESRQVAEQARETGLGRPDLPARALPRQLPAAVDPPVSAGAARSGRSSPRFYGQLSSFLHDQVDSVAIDQTGEYPEHVIDGLRKLGAFGMKIPKEYGGLGFTVSEYCKVDGDDRQHRQQRERAALGAPIDRRAAAAQALRHAGAEEEVPAALCRGRDLGVRAHGAARRLRSRQPLHHRASATATSSS